MKHALAAIALLIGLPAMAADFSIGGWREVVVSVSDAGEHRRFFEAIGEWEPRYSGDLDPAQLSAWALPEEAGASETLMGNPGTQTGFIRLVQFSGVEQTQIRSNSQTWEAGGLLDINIRVNDMEAVFEPMQQQGWQGATDPLDFTFGPFEVTEWITRGPDGLSFALIQRHAPPLEGWPHIRSFSRAFNSTQVVADMEPSRKFFMDVLGFKKYMYHKGASSGDGRNVLGLPYSVAQKAEREIWILHPEGLNEGSVELLSFEGLHGRDFAPLAEPPNLGMLMLRFPVQGLDALAAHLRAHQVELRFEPTQVQMPPYGSVRSFAVQAPNGTWLEFFEEKGE